MKTNIAQSLNRLFLDVAMDIQQGNLHRVKQLGVTPDTLQTLNSLTKEELFFLANSGICLLEIKCNTSLLNRMVGHARDESTKDQRINRALKLGASNCLMKTFFGLNSCEVTNRRSANGIQKNPGRGSILTEEQDAAIWYKWKAFGLSDTESIDALDGMMNIAEEMDIPLQAVWKSVETAFPHKMTREVYSFRGVA